MPNLRNGSPNSPKNLKGELTMKEKFAKLIDVKSFVTLGLTICLMGLLFSGVEPSKEVLALFCTSYGSIVTYFFTRKDGDGK